MAKSTDAEMEKRITAVYDLLLIGTSRAGIVQYAAEKWQVETRIVDTYIRRARNLLKKHTATSRELALATARARLNLLYQKALAAKDYRGALAVQKEINALEALYAPPAAQTLRLIGLDDNQLIELAQLLEANGYKPSDIFNNMLRRLAANKPKDTP